jgi:VanZ family protein
VRGSPRWAVFFGAAATVLALVLLVEGSRPASHLPGAPQVAHFDKLLHFGAHFVLASLLAWGALLWRAGRLRERLGAACAGAVFADFTLGLGVEVSQYFFGRAHGRLFEWLDVAANTAGAACATIAMLMVVRGALGAYIKQRRARPRT